ncbi:MAG: hypothetical protein NC124_02515 [Clostridium sp.]|nr:hypothetical protein [Clostridium sp.]
MTEMIRFKNKEEFDEHFKKMAEYSGDEFNDELCIEGNSDKTLGWLRSVAEQIGYENVSVSDDNEYTDTFEFDIKGIAGNFCIDGSDVCYGNGVIRIWCD